MIRNALQRFMYGRYGSDQLNLFLIVLYLLLYFLSAVTGFFLLYWLSLILVCVAIFRILSRNIPARRRENDKFLRGVLCFICNFCINTLISINFQLFVG